MNAIALLNIDLNAENKRMSQFPIGRQFYSHPQRGFMDEQSRDHLADETI